MATETGSLWVQRRPPRGRGEEEGNRDGEETKDKLLMILIVLKVQLLTDTLEQVPMLG